MTSFSHKSISHLTPANVHSWLLELKEKHGFSERNLISIKPLLNHFFKWLVTENYLKENPLAKVKLNHRAPRTRSRIILSEAEVLEALRLLKLQSPFVVFPIILTLVFTAARKGQILGLLWKNVDFENRLLHVKSKNGDLQAIRMPDPIYDLLKAIPKVHELVFINEFGRTICPTQIDDALIKLQSNNPSMKRWRCHDLRHSFANNFLKRHGNMYQLQALLGHKDIRLTIDLYGQLQAVQIAPVDLYINK